MRLWKRSWGKRLETAADADGHCRGSRVFIAHDLPTGLKKAEALAGKPQHPVVGPLPEMLEGIGALEPRIKSRGFIQNKEWRFHLPSTIKSYRFGFEENASGQAAVLAVETGSRRIFTRG